MSNGFDINLITGKANEIALSVDNKYVKDGRLSLAESSIFLFDCKEKGIEVEKESWYQQFNDFRTKASESPKTEQYVAVPDATYVAPKPNSDEISISLNPDINLHDITVKRAEICEKMQEKWCKTFKNAPLKEDFFLKLYDLMKTLNVKISEKDFDKNHYSSPEEQAMDELIAMFAGEARLNPRTIGTVKGKPTFYGLFQLSQDGLNAAKKWAKNHPNAAGMSNINQNMTLQKFRQLSGEKQLDYLVAYIGSSRDASNIPENESLSPAKLWSMVKLPNLNENNSQKKERRERTIIQKQDSIARIFNRNNIQRGIPKQ